LSLAVPGVRPRQHTFARLPDTASPSSGLCGRRRTDGRRASLLTGELSAHHVVAKDKRAADDDRQSEQSRTQVSHDCCNCRPRFAQAPKSITADTLD
jgi:hypothetical protein